MENIGQYLKEKREKLLLTIEEISHETRIKPYIIKQLENNEFDSIGDHGIVKIYVVTYCRAISGDEGLVLSRLDKVSKKVNDFPLNIKSGKTKKPVFIPANLLWFIMLGISAVGLSYGVYYLYQEEMLTFENIRNQFTIAERPTQTQQRIDTPTPDERFLMHREFYDMEHTMDNAVAQEINNEETEVTMETSPQIHTRSPRLPVNDYVSELLFNNTISPLNPEI